MSDRSDVLAHYRQWMTERWRKGHLTLPDIRALKVFCEAHTLTVDEHEAIGSEVGVDRRELMDDNNQLLADWLRARRQPLPPGSAGLRFAPSASAPPWKLRLGLPLAWQNALAGLAAIVVIVTVILVLTVR